MGVIAALFVLSLGLQSQAENQIYKIENCAPEKPFDEILFADDFFKWNLPRAEMDSVFNKTYESKKRLARRAYFDQRAQEFKLPFDSDRGGDVKLPLTFVKNVIAHVEAGLEQGKVEYVIFPDLGHSHFFIPQEKYDREYKGLSPMGQYYEKFLADPDLKILYHTHEQMLMLDENREVLPDPQTQFRFRWRNLVGLNNGSKEVFFLQNPESKANSATDLEGHFYWGAGFNISSNQKGCFYYVKQGQKMYFDLSLFDLGYSKVSFD